MHARATALCLLSWLWCGVVWCGVVWWDRYLRNVFYQRLGMHHAAFYNEYTDYDNEDSLDERLADLTETVDEGLAEVYDTLEVRFVQWVARHACTSCTEAQQKRILSDEVQRTCLLYTSPSPRDRG